MAYTMRIKLCLMNQKYVFQQKAIASCPNVTFDFFTYGGISGIVQLAPGEFVQLSPSHFELFNKLMR